MEVFAVEEKINFDYGGEIVGVCSSLDKAKELINKRKKIVKEDMFDCDNFYWDVYKSNIDDEEVTNVLTINYLEI